MRVSFGPKGSAAQLPTWKGEETPAVAPSDPLIVPWIDIGAQLVGLNWKFGRSTLTEHAFELQGDAFQLRRQRV